MAKDFDGFMALLDEPGTRERVDSFAASLEVDGEDELVTIAKAEQRRTIAILREYHRWANS